MKNTIKEELQEEVIKEELLDDNTLLQFVKVESKKEQLRVRYITKTASRNYIEEDVIGYLDLTNAYKEPANSQEPTTYYCGDGVVIDYNDKAIAYFISNLNNPVDNSDLLLTKLYDIKRHQFVEHDFLNTMYNEFFNTEKNIETKKTHQKRI